MNSLYEHDLTKHSASSMVNKKTEIPTYHSHCIDGTLGHGGHPGPE